MVLTQFRARRKPTGGRYKQARGKRLHEMGRSPTMTKLGEKRARQIKVMSGAVKVRILKADTANLFDPKTKTYSQVKIKTVSETPANRHFVRRNIITKGCIIDTEKGKAKVTSRPGQHGTLNAVLITS